MSNKRNVRRGGQRVRSEVPRKQMPGPGKSRVVFMASLPAERARKEQQRFWYKPTKRERVEREKRIRRFRCGKPSKTRKPRSNVKRWLPSHDLDT